MKSHVPFVGSIVGSAVGARVGFFVGFLVGDLVGAPINMYITRIQNTQMVDTYPQLVGASVGLYRLQAKPYVFVQL